MPTPRKYTPEMDAAILAAEGRGGLEALVERLEASVGALYARRKVLREREHGHRGPQRKSDLFYRRSSSRAKTQEAKLAPVFARPSWFEEDLTLMTKGGLR